MRCTEIVKSLEEIIRSKGDCDVEFAANRHGYADARILQRENKTVFALFEKTPA